MGLCFALPPLVLCLELLPWLLTWVCSVWRCDLFGASGDTAGVFLDRVSCHGGCSSSVNSSLMGVWLSTLWG